MDKWWPLNLCWQRQMTCAHMDTLHVSIYSYIQTEAITQTNSFALLSVCLQRVQLCINGHCACMLLSKFIFDVESLSLTVPSHQRHSVCWSQITVWSLVAESLKWAKQSSANNICFLACQHMFTVSSRCFQLCISSQKVPKNVAKYTPVDSLRLDCVYRIGKSTTENQTNVLLIVKVWTLVMKGHWQLCNVAK